jgi:hypothetical protein
MDEQHETPCGQAIKKLCERADQLFGEIEYRNLSQISVSHLYNLRGSPGYKKHRQVFTKTQSRKVNPEKSILANDVSQNRMVNPVIYGSTASIRET